ncbi:Kinesin-like protein KIF6 [Durusdinium trenchii]|uniref:Kinesin-like protein n=1 Tax=Durusdinium trenchii TaxID=1381693 RepID=A0ABP0M3U5_9DINO
MASNIKVFIRVRPGKAAEGFQADPERGALSFKLPDTEPDYYVNNQKTAHNFQFDGVLGMQVKQEEVLETVARPVIQDVLNGVNGTIFAYGQTGSGKTFTITGGAEHYEDRGLIPRTLRMMFEAFRKGPAQYRMYISYLEIYQDSGYDLLRDDSVRNLQDLPKVQLREDEDGNMHLRNLSVNLAATEEDALNLLFLGDTNRVVAETPMNDASTRSHCLFIIWVDSTQEGSDVVRRSKLHLVDLAGSERVSQTGVNGKLLAEAKSINVSLHYLERVIVALHSRSKGNQVHVPYRDSMMTSVLRDSLGGNCRTTMVGCIAAEASNLPESMSTCRFAQRVAQITNTARVNEELDPNLLIARLKREVSELKREVQVARSSGEGEPEAFCFVAAG